MLAHAARRGLPGHSGPLSSSGPRGSRTGRSSAWSCSSPGRCCCSPTAACPRAAGGPVGAVLLVAPARDRTARDARPGDARRRRHRPAGHQPARRAGVRGRGSTRSASSASDSRSAWSPSMIAVHRRTGTGATPAMRACAVGGASAGAELRALDRARDDRPGHEDGTLRGDVHRQRSAPSRSPPRSRCCTTGSSRSTVLLRRSFIVRGRRRRPSSPPFAVVFTIVATLAGDGARPPGRPSLSAVAAPTWVRSGPRRPEALRPPGRRDSPCP